MVSVIIPSYNRAEQVEKSVRSVLNQTYVDLELIIVDDCSVDNTEEIIRKINDKRLRYYRLNENKGACYARNLGIQKSKYDLIAFHDSDDIWYPDKLEKQVKLLKQLPEEYGMVFCSLKRDYGKDKIVPPLDAIDTSGFIYSKLLKGNFISTQTILCKKNVFAEVGSFDDSLPAFQDWDLVLRVSKKFKIKHLQECLVEVIISGDSISLNHSKRLFAFEQIIRKYKHEVSKRVLKDWYYEAGYIAIKARYPEKVIEYLRKAIDFYSRRGLIALKKLVVFLLKY